MHTNRRRFLKASGLLTASASLSLTGIYAEQNNNPSTNKNIHGLKKEKPVVVIRTSWGDSNIGDQAHTPGIIHTLKTYIPDVEIILWHGANNVPVTEQQVMEHYPDVKIVHGKFFDGDKPFEGEIHDAFQRATLFIFNSGMAMNFGLYSYDWPANMSNLTPFIWCKEHNIPFGIYGQSFDKFAHPSLEIYRNVLSQAAFVYCRDGASLQFLQDNKFRTPVLEFGPDAAFGITIRNEAKGLAYLKAEALEEKKFLAVITLTNTPPLHAKQDPLNPSTRTPLQEQQDETRMQKVREMITEWVRTTGYKVLLAPEANKEMQPAKDWVYDLLPEDVKTKVVWRNEFWTASEAMSVYAKAHSIFGMEPHSLIMGLTLGIPIIHAWPPSHGRKCFMFRDIGLDKWLFPVDESTSKQWTDILMSNYKDYTAAQKKVAAAMAFVRQKQAAGMKVIKEVST